MKISFFSRPKPRQFNYKPIYYDKKKEEQEKLREKMGLSDKLGTEERIRARMRYQWERKKEKTKRSRAERNRLLIYLAIIVLLIYLLYFGKVV